MNAVLNDKAEADSMAADLARIESLADPAVLDAMLQHDEVTMMQPPQTSVARVPVAYIENDLAFPSHLLNPPGVLKLFMSWQLASAPKPQPFLALVAALSLAATALARMVKTETGLRTNLYLVAVANSGAGKDHGRKCLKKALTVAGFGDLLGGEELASGKGLLSAAARQPASVFQLDEFGLMLKAVRSKNAGVHLAEIVSIFMKLFSSADTTYHGTEYTDQKNRPRQDIAYPCVNLHATTTPEPLFDALGGADVTSGYLNRLLIFFAPETKGRMRRVDISSPPPQLLEWLKVCRGLRHTPLIAVTADDPITISMTLEATRLFDELHDFHPGGHPNSPTDGHLKLPHLS